MKHTKGPWRIGNEQAYQVDRYAKNAEWARIRGVDGGLIAKVESVSPKGQRKSCDFDIESANARLIAAAPDLLEACKEALGQIESDHLNYAAEENGDPQAWDDGEARVVAEKLRAAINRAEGRE